MPISRDLLVLLIRSNHKAQPAEHIRHGVKKARDETGWVVALVYIYYYSLVSVSQRELALSSLRQGLIRDTLTHTQKGEGATTAAAAPLCAAYLFFTFQFIHL